jgi:peptidoglycan/LPS O-acetylase OafA/YrhL
MAQSSKIFNEQKLRLYILDGMRGFAALYVVLCHISLEQLENLPQ